MKIVIIKSKMLKHLRKLMIFFAKRDVVYGAISKICDAFGFERHMTHDSIQNGIIFRGLCADPNKDVVDKALWKTSKHRSGYLNVLPRATAKEHKALYESMIPERMHYTDLNKLILVVDIAPWSKSYGYRYKKGEYFMFETSLAVSPLAIEIFGSEYRKVEVEEPAND